MAKTKQKISASKYDESEVYILKDPDDYDVIDAAADIGNVESRKFGKDHVIIINGKQLKEIDKRKLPYELWVPTNGINGTNHNMELRK